MHIGVNFREGTLADGFLICCGIVVTRERQTRLSSVSYDSSMDLAFCLCSVYKQAALGGKKPVWKKVTYKQPLNNAFCQGMDLQNSLRRWVNVFIALNNIYRSYHHMFCH